MEEQNKKKVKTISVSGIHFIIALLLNKLLPYLGIATVKTNWWQTIRYVFINPRLALSLIPSITPIIFLVLLALMQWRGEKIRHTIKLLAGILAALAAVSLLVNFVSNFRTYNLWNTYKSNFVVFTMTHIDQVLMTILYAQIAIATLRCGESHIADYRTLRIASFVALGFVPFAMLMAGEAAIVLTMLGPIISSIFMIHALTRLPLTLMKREQATTYPLKSVALVALAVAVVLGIGALLSTIQPSGSNRDSDKGGKCALCGDHTRWIYREGRWFCVSCARKLNLD